MTCPRSHDESLRSHDESLLCDPHGRFGPPAAVRDLVARRPARFRGRLACVRTLAAPGGPRFEAELSDATGSVVLVFLGRRSIPGLVPGTVLEAWGTPRAHRGRTEVLNPFYELLASPDDAEPIRPARDQRSDQ
jgi:hypothetical protein